MPTYSLLGATGSTGSAVLRTLLAEPPEDLKLKILIRSKSKLLKLFSHIEETLAFEVEIIEGTSTDIAALERCLSRTDAALVCVGTNDSTPNDTLMYDTAAAMTDALKALHKTTGSDYRTPTLIWLRAAPINPELSKHMPAFLRSLLWFCLRFAYGDDKKSGELLEAAAQESPGLLQVIFVDPGALHDAGGTERTGYELVLDGPLSPALSYADLGGAFCELAERRQEFHGKGVGVSATGKVRATWGTNMWALLCGAKNNILCSVGLM